MRMRLSSVWSWLALAVVLIWTLLPIYWFLKNSLLTPDEIARFPQPLYPLEPTPAAFFNIFGFEYEMADGLVRRGSGQANQIIRGLGNSLIVLFHSSDGSQLGWSRRNCSIWSANSPGSVERISSISPFSSASRS